MAQQPDSRKFLSELYSYLSSEGAMGNVSENDFLEDMKDADKARKAYAFFSSRNLLEGADSFDTFYRPFQNVYSSQKKSEVGTEGSTTTLPERQGPEVREGFVMEEQGAPMRSVPRSVEVPQVEAAAAPQAGAMPEQRPVPETPIPLMKPRTAETPAPIAPGQEAAFAQAEKQRQAFGFPTQEAAPDTFGQVDADFPIKSANKAIQELEQARRDRQQGQRTKPTGEQEMSEIEAAFRGKGQAGMVPKFSSFLENTRVGKVISQGAPLFGAISRSIGTGALNIPELLANTQEDIALEFTNNDLQKQLKQGKITEQEYNDSMKASREIFRALQGVSSRATGAPNIRATEWVMDNYLNADELEDAARKNLQEVQARVDNADKGFEGLAGEGRYADALQYAATQAIGSLPYMITAMLPGGAYVVGGVAAQDKYRQIQDMGGDMSATDALNAVGTGLVEGLSEAVSARVAKGALKLVQKLGKEAAEKTLKQQLVQVGRRMVGATLEEGASEGLAQFAENVIDKVTIDPNKDLTEGVIDAVAIGALTGGALTGAGGAIGLAGRVRGAEPAAPGAPTPAAPEAGAPAPAPGTEAPMAEAPAPAAPEAAAPMAETPAAPAAPAAEPTPTAADLFPEPEEAQRMSGYVESILAGITTELTPEQADEQIDTYLEGLLDVDPETGEMIAPKSGYSKEVYDEVMINRGKLSQLISQQSKQKANAAQKIQEVQPQGGEPEYPGAESLRPQAPTETNIGDRPVVGGMQPQEGGQQEGQVEARPQIPIDEEFMQRSAKQRREAGKFTMGGVEYVRQEPDMKSPRGETGKIVFADNPEGRAEFTYKLIEAETLQPSHLGGVINPMHFIPEAQPKRREEGTDSIAARDRIVNNVQPERLGQHWHAYEGAPVVNARNEVIQGNNRADGIRLGYANNSIGKYKTWLQNNAQSFGLSPDAVAGMKNPVLVREVNESDEKAISLGQWRFNDVETGGTTPVDPMTAANKLPDDKKAEILDILFGDNPDATLRESIRENWKKLLLGPMKGYLSNMELNYIQKNNAITQKGVDVLSEMVEKFLFVDAPRDLQAMFDALPYRIREGIRKAARFIFAVPKEASILKETQQFIEAYHKFQTSDQNNIAAWLTQGNIFTGESAPADIYPPFIVGLLKKVGETDRKGNPVARETTISNWYKSYAQKVAKPKEAKVGEIPGFEMPEREVMSKEQAVREAFGIDYNTGEVVISETLAEPETIEPIIPGAQLIEADIDGNLLYDGSGRVDKKGRPIPAGEPGTAKNPLRSRGLSAFVKMLDTDKVSEADFMAFMENEIKKRASDRLLSEPGKTFDEIAKEMRENAQARYKQIKSLAPLAKRLGVKIYPGTPNETKTKLNFGSFVYSGDKGFVYINAIRAQEKVLRHELAHVAMTSLYKINKAGTKSTNDLVSSLFPKVIDAVKSTGDTDLINALQKVMDDFAENKKSLYQPSQYAEEYLVEFIARMDEGLRGKLLDNTTLGKIERAVNALLDSILGKGVLNVRFSNTQDLLDFLGAVSRGVSNGDIASMDEALSMYAMGRLDAPVQALYWKKKEVKGSRELVKGITDRIEKGNYAEIKSAEGIVNEILAGTFGRGKYIAKFTGTQDAKGFFENIAEEIRINGQRVPSSHVVRAELLLAVNDYLQTIATASPQLDDDMSAEVKADMQAYYEKFPPMAGKPIVETDAEKRMAENMQTQLESDQRSYGLYAEKVSVPEVVNQDNLKGLPIQQKAQMLQGRTGNIPSIAAIQTAASPDPHGMFAVLETVQTKLNALARGVVDKKDVAKAAFAHAFGDARAHFQAVMDKVRVMDEAFISTAKQGGQNYYMLDGHGAASLLLNSESGQRFIENAANNQRDTDFEQSVADILQPFGVNATELFDKFYAAMQANETGGIKAAEKALGSNRSLAASILGLGDVSKKDAAALEKSIETGSPMAVNSTGIQGLDARADAVASAVGMDKGLAREAMKNMVARHLTEEKDLDFFEDTLVLMDEEFYSQLSGRSDALPEGIEVMNDMSTNPYGQKPYYKQARAFVWNEIKNGKSDKQIVDALQTLYANGANGYDAREFFQNVTGRKYRSQTDPVDEMMDSAFMFMRSILRLNLKEAGVAATVFRRTAPKSRLRDIAYNIDFQIGNDLAFFRKLQRDVEKSMGSLMPKEMAGYQKMQLYISAAAFEIDQFAKRFYGDKKTTTASGVKDSFISRLTRSGVRSVNEFNTFLTAMHKQERMDRLIDIQERFLLQLYNDFAETANKYGAAQLFPYTMADIPAYDPVDMIAEIDKAIANTADPDAQMILTMKRVRFRGEENNLKRGEQRKDKARQDFTQYLKSKGVANPATVKPGDLKAMPQFADHFAFMQEFKDMQKEYLDILHGAGQIDDARYDHLVNGTSSQSGVVWEYYVPLVYDEYVYNDEMGLPNPKAERLVNRFGIKGLTRLMGKRKPQQAPGTGRPVSPLLYEDASFEKPVEVLFHRMAGAIRFKHRNDAIRSVARTIESYPSPDYKIFSARSLPRVDRWGNPNGVTDLISEEIKKQSQAFYEGGKRKYIYFADPDSPMLAKLKSGTDDVSGIMQLLMSLNNIARGLFTYLRPSFLVANLFRDFQEAFTNIQVEGRAFNLAANAPGTPGFKKFKKQIIKAYAKRYGQSAAYLTKNLFGVQGDPIMNSYYRELQELGGLMSWSFDSMELIRDQMNTVEENINYAERYAAGKSPIEATKRLFANTTIEAVHKVSDKIEAFSRLATYAAMRDVGVEPIRAAEMAKNITLNFEKKGANKVIRSIGPLWLFLNPAIQGIRKSGKQMATPEGRKALLWYAGVTFTLRGLLLSLPEMIGYFGEDEEKEKEARSDIETYIYSRYVSETKAMVPNPLDPNNPILLPKPFGNFRVAAATGEGLADLMSGYRTPVDVAANISRQLKGAMDPIAGTSSWANQYMEVMPLPILSPVFETMANSDHYGRAVVYDMSGSFDYLKANKKTPQIYRDVAKGLYMHTPNHIDISPSSLQHVFESYIDLGPAQFVKNSRDAFKDVATEDEKSGKDKFKRLLVETTFINRVLYNDNISKEDKNDLYNYLSMSADPPGRWNEKKVEYAERVIALARDKELVNERVLQSSLTDLISQVIQSGKLYQTVPGRDITWEDWYMEQASPMGQKSLRQMSEALDKLIEQTGAEQK
jgi:hypothetical protein